MCAADARSVCDSSVLVKYVNIIHVNKVLGALSITVIRIIPLIPFNPLMGTLKPQNNGPLYSNTVIGTLAVDEWAVTFGTARTGPAQSPPRCTKCNSLPMKASVLTSYNSICHYNYLSTLNG